MSVVFHEFFTRSEKNQEIKAISLLALSSPSRSLFPFCTYLGGLRLESLPGGSLTGLVVLVQLHFRALHDFARLRGLAAFVGEGGGCAGHGDQREESDRLGGHHCREVSRKVR